MPCSAKARMMPAVNSGRRASVRPPRSSNTYISFCTTMSDDSPTLFSNTSAYSKRGTVTWPAPALPSTRSTAAMTRRQASCCSGRTSLVPLTDRSLMTRASVRPARPRVTEPGAGAERGGRRRRGHRLARAGAGARRSWRPVGRPPGLASWRVSGEAGRQAVAPQAPDDDEDEARARALRGDDLDARGSPQGDLGLDAALAVHVRADEDVGVVGAAAEPVAEVPALQHDLAPGLGRHRHRDQRGDHVGADGGLRCTGAHGQGHEAEGQPGETLHYGPPRRRAYVRPRSGSMHCFIAPRRPLGVPEGSAARARRYHTRRHAGGRRDRHAGAGRPGTRPG